MGIQRVWPAISSFLVSLPNRVVRKEKVHLLFFFFFPLFILTVSLPQEQMLEADHPEHQQSAWEGREVNADLVHRPDNPQK